MKVCICDRCKKQFNEKQLYQACKFPHYSITMVSFIGSGGRKVDLCSDCMEDFKQWLNEKHWEVKES